jgi:hypothetical protein
MSEDDGLKAMGQVIQIDEARIRDHLGEMVRGTVEETLNALLDAEADRLCGAGRYERSQGRQDTRAGSYERSLHTVAGEVNLRVPKLRQQTFETAIIERYRRRESSVEEALIEMYGSSNGVQEGHLRQSWWQVAREDIHGRAAPRTEPDRSERQGQAQEGQRAGREACRVRDRGQARVGVPTDRRSPRRQARASSRRDGRRSPHRSRIQRRRADCDPAQACWRRARRE